MIPFTAAPYPGSGGLSLIQINGGNHSREVQPAFRPGITSEDCVETSGGEFCPGGCNKNLDRRKEKPNRLFLEEIGHAGHQNASGKNDSTISSLKEDSDAGVLRGGAD
jgi:hypothetical protein